MSKKDGFRITFAGSLAVHLMGKGYHGERLTDAVQRLTTAGGIDQANVQELQALEEAVREWRERKAV